jgi:predicted nucleic acid-binding protein
VLFCLCLRNPPCHHGHRSLGDALIAGIASDLGAIVVTRNRPDFARQGVATLEY